MRSSSSERFRTETPWSRTLEGRRLSAVRTRLLISSIASLGSVPTSKTHMIDMSPFERMLVV